MERDSETTAAAAISRVPIPVAPLPDIGDLLACADYACAAWENPELNVTYDLHEGMRRLRKSVTLTAARMPELKLAAPPAETRSPAAERLDRLQRIQHEHDEIYHPDIVCLGTANRLRHLCFHGMKYVGLFAANGTHDLEFRRALVDLFVIAVSAANTLGVRLSNGLPGGADLKEAGRALAVRLGLGEGEGGESARRANFVVATAAANGRFAKACEAIDHVEDYPVRETMQEAVQALAELAIAMAAALRMNIDGAALNRLDIVEQMSFRRHLDPRAGASAYALAAEQALEAGQGTYASDRDA